MLPGNGETVSESTLQKSVESSKVSSLDGSWRPQLVILEFIFLRLAQNAQLVNSEDVMPAF